MAGSAAAAPRWSLLDGNLHNGEYTEHHEDPTVSSAEIAALIERPRMQLAIGKGVRLDHERTSMCALNCV